MRVFLFLLLTATTLASQTFIREEIPVNAIGTWEMRVHGDYIYYNELHGYVSRVNLNNYEKEFLFIAPDFYESGDDELLEKCNRGRSNGTLGFELHPDFNNPETSYMYLYYSFNGGTEEKPVTQFKLARLYFDHSQSKVTDSETLDVYPGGYEHMGGRLLVINQNGKDYILLSTGDYGLNDDNCYDNPEDNPVWDSQNPDTKNGKVLRYNLDGSIPEDNPIPGNPVYTRGHRNPQGLTFNKEKEIIYSAEHGDATDDEINVLFKGKNYGWPYIHGYHDGNYEGETEFINNYVPNENIEDDALVEPIQSFCQFNEPEFNSYLDYCTIAPSDLLYYDSDAIPFFNNSLLVVTLKDGRFTDRSVYQLKLAEDGLSLLESTPENPNPVVWFAEDQKSNGRLRDIAISDDGKTIYLCHNGGPEPDHANIIKYTYSPSSVDLGDELLFGPNPVYDNLNILSDGITDLEIFDSSGNSVYNSNFPTNSINLSILAPGVYFVKYNYMNSSKTYKFCKL